jgi:alcohol dehydrogenase class IV
MSKEVRKFVAPEFLFGEGAIHLVGQYAHNLGAVKVLLVTDAGVMQANWHEPVMTSLAAHGLTAEIFSSVTPNPRAEEVMEGARRFQEAGCNAIVAVGGGSPIDCAKGIGLVHANQKHILDFEGVDQITIPMPPMLCVPTTGGSSADLSQFAIISCLQEKRKIAIISKAVVPDISLLDPTTLTTMPPYLTACTAIDALVHAIEAFVSTGHSPITDTHALQAIQLIMENLPSVMAEPLSIDKREKIMLGSIQAGLAFSNASLGAVHAMAHSLGGLLDLPHGECNALLLDHVISFNYQKVPERFARIAGVMGIETNRRTQREIHMEITKAIHRLRNMAGVKDSLAERGVHKTDIPALAHNAMNDACLVTNPRIPNQRDLEVLYEEAL